VPRTMLDVYNKCLQTYGRKGSAQAPRCEKSLFTRRTLRAIYSHSNDELNSKGPVLKLIKGLGLVRGAFSPGLTKVVA
jgi:hypothetical protein